METEQEPGFILDSDVDVSSPSGQDEILIPEASFVPPSLSPGQFKQLELLQHLALYSELLIVITGEEGAGKSFLANALIASREEPEYSLLIKADFMLGLPAILQQIAQSQDLPDPGKDVSVALNTLAEYCQQLVENDESFLLIIDQADQLDAETLQAIAQLALIAPANFHVALAGRPALEAEVLSLPEAQPPVHIMSVEPFSQDESENLLLEAYPEEEWDQPTLDALISLSDGAPGKLLSNGKKYLDGESLSQPGKAPQGIKFPITHVAAMLMVASALLVSFLYSGSDATNEVESDLAKPVVQDETSDSQLVDSSTGLTEVQPQQVVAAGSEEGSLPQDEPDFNYPDTTSASAVASLAKIADSAEVASPVVEDKPGPVQLNEPAPVLYKLDEAILLAAPTNNYVIQLFGSHTLKNARAFASEYRAQIGTTLMYQTQHKGKDWYVVVLGPYVNRAAGVSEVKKLPAKLRAQTPWVRSVESVQKVIKN